MKTFLPIPLFVLLAGCSSGDNAPTPPPSADAGMTAQQSLDKVQNDPKVPDGLKQIQAQTMAHQPGVGR